MSLPGAQWQEIGWNGITLQLPSGWQPTVILPSYLFFENNGIPVFEIKWEQAQGSFSAERVLSRISRVVGAEHPVSPWMIPASLAIRPESFVSEGFRVRQDKYDCHGIILHCLHCQRTTLMQFYLDPAGEETTVRRIMQSFADHSAPGDTLWAVYDIRALLPVRAKLQSSEFVAGRYTLAFAWEKAVITLYRFRPAALILANQSLVDFGASLADGASPVVSTTDTATWTGRATGFNLMRARLRRQPVWLWLQLRYLVDKNVILGVRAEGKRSFDPQQLEKIAGNLTVTEPV